MCSRQGWRDKQLVDRQNVKEKVIEKYRKRGGRGRKERVNEMRDLRKERR